MSENKIMAPTAFRKAYLDLVPKFECANGPDGLPTILPFESALRHGKRDKSRAGIL